MTPPTDEWPNLSALTSPATVTGPKKGDWFAVCRHVHDDTQETEHWYFVPRDPRQRSRLYEWVCVCERCHAAAARSPRAPLPAYAAARAVEDVGIDVEVAGAN